MARLRVPVHIMNVTNQDQVLSEGTSIGHGQPAVCAAAIDDQKHESRWKQGLCKQLREVIAGARPNVSLTEPRHWRSSLLTIKTPLKQRAVTTGAQRKYATGSIPVTPGPFASHHADSL